MSVDVIARPSYKQLSVDLFSAALPLQAGEARRIRSKSEFSYLHIMARKLPASRPPAKDVDPDRAEYDLRSLRAPALVGIWLWLFVRLILQTVLARLVVPKLLRDSGFAQLDAACPEAPLPKPRCDAPRTFNLARLPLTPSAISGLSSPAQLLRRSLPRLSQGLAPVAAGQPRIRDFHEAFRARRTTPVEVAETAIAFLKDYERRVGPARRQSLLCSWDEEDIRKQARQSAARWAASRPLSLLDGVPVAVKDESDVQGHPTSHGTRFWQSDGVAVKDKDSAVALALRSAGAILLGKASMHELGMDSRGINPWFGTPDNPAKPGHVTGGSSSGSAAAVGLGLCPLTVGTDGGGSIRIPSGLCGVVGLKTTHGRLLQESRPDTSVVVQGPIAASVEDAAIGIAVMAASASPKDAPRYTPPSLWRCKAHAPLTGLRVGVYGAWTDSASPEVRSKAGRAMEALRELGAREVEIRIPELEAMRVALTVVFGIEALAFVESLGGLQKRLPWVDGNTAACLLAAHVGKFRERYLDRANAMRARGTVYLDRVFERCDIVLTPTTPITAPRIPTGSEWFGSSDLQQTGDLMRYVFPANFLGLPALSINAGFSREGLPIGVQLMGPHWSENALLYVGACLEARLADTVLREKPPSFVPHCRYKL